MERYEHQRHEPSARNLGVGHPKSEATFRPLHTQDKVLIADSWFGSVPCAAALHENGVYAIMNVKTCHKGYPKEEVSNQKIAIEIDPTNEHAL